MTKRRGSRHVLAIFAVVSLVLLASVSFPVRRVGLVMEAGAEPAGWSNDTRLSFYGKADYPAIAVNGNIVHTAWRNSSSTTDHFDLTYRRSLDGGETWEPEKNLTCYTDGTHLAEEPRIAVNGSDVYVVFTDDRSGMREIYFMNSSDNGVTWSQERNISKLDLMYSANPDIAVWGDNIYVVWEDNRGQRAEVYFRKSDDMGATWSQEMNLTADDDRSSVSPAITVWENNVHVAFTDYRDLRWELYYKKSLDGGNNWVYEKVLSKVDGWNSGGHAGNIAVSGSNVHIVWMDNNNTSAQEILYSRSLDNGDTWEPERMVSEDDGYEGGGQALAVEGNRVQVVWGDERDQYPYTNAQEIYVNTSLNGGLDWSGSVRLTNAPNSSGGPAVAIGNGTTHIVWADNRTGDVYNFEIYYKRTLSSGQPQEFNASIPLQCGWNFITMPLNITDWRASDLCREIEANTTLYVLCMTTMYQGMFSDYLYRDGATWHRLDGTDGYMNFSGVNNFLIKPGVGYFVFVNSTNTSDTLWELSGEKFTAPAPVSFGYGWSFIGVPYHTLLTLNASDMMEQINAQNGASSCVKVSNWTTSDTWESWDGSMGLDFALDDAPHPRDANGRGWAALCNNTGTWTPL